MDFKTVKNLFYYRNGNLFWREQRKAIGWSKGRARKMWVPVGSPAGPEKRLIFNYKGKIYPVYRLIFLWNKGFLPDNIDHIDGNPLNNRIENLRPCNAQQNQGNRKQVSRNNTTGYKGVIRLKSGKFKAMIGVDSNPIYIGTYNSAEEAARAYNEIALEWFGSFANINIIK